MQNKLIDPGRSRNKNNLYFFAEIGSKLFEPKILTTSIFFRLYGSFLSSTCSRFSQKPRKGVYTGVKLRLFKKFDVTPYFSTNFAVERMTS